jgi:NACHT domain- and WD repeat-containing protein
VKGHWDPIVLLVELILVTVTLNLTNLFPAVGCRNRLDDLDNARNLSWLPNVLLPPHVSIVVSTLPTVYKETLERRHPPASMVDVPVMPLPEGEAVLKRWLNDAGCSLQPSQYQEVMSAFSVNGLQLYLKLAFEEARRWKKKE